ncbi:MAG TPA: hypothetical protein VJB13_00860 [Candidatus Nanoarchaeia archaeon]|nr:hypothetical protein [Candidatus Nanoarchaeia archaeon]
MKIITPTEFDVEKKNDLLYLGRIRAADYVWVHRSGRDNSSANLECLARDLQGDILVTQTVNDDDWSWANQHLSGKVGMDDIIFVSAGDLYRDPAINRKARYISSELLAQIKPQLEDLGYVYADKYNGASLDEHGAESTLLEEATREAADYVILESSSVQDYTNAGFTEVQEFIAISSGRIYKLKGKKQRMK